MRNLFVLFVFSVIIVTISSTETTQQSTAQTPTLSTTEQTPQSSSQTLTTEQTPQSASQTPILSTTEQTPSSTLQIASSIAQTLTEIRQNIRTQYCQKKLFYDGVYFDSGESYLKNVPGQGLNGYGDIRFIPSDFISFTKQILLTLNQIRDGQFQQLSGYLFSWEQLQGADGNSYKFLTVKQGTADFELDRRLISLRDDSYYVSPFELGMTSRNIKYDPLLSTGYLFIEDVSLGNSFSNLGVHKLVTIKEIGDMLHLVSKRFNRILPFHLIGTNNYEEGLTECTRFNVREIVSSGKSYLALTLEEMTNTQAIKSLDINRLEGRHHHYYADALVNNRILPTKFNFADEQMQLQVVGKTFGWRNMIDIQGIERKVLTVESSDQISNNINSQTSDNNEQISQQTQQLPLSFEQRVRNAAYAKQAQNIQRSYGGHQTLLAPAQLYSDGSTQLEYFSNISKFDISIKNSFQIVTLRLLHVYYSIKRDDVFVKPEYLVGTPNYQSTINQNQKFGSSVFIMDDSTIQSAIIILD